MMEKTTAAFGEQHRTVVEGKARKCGTQSFDLGGGGGPEPIQLRPPVFIALLAPHSGPAVDGGDLAAEAAVLCPQEGRTLEVLEVGWRRTSSSERKEETGVPPQHRHRW